MFKKFSWGHGIIIALGSFIAFILFMIFIFPNGKQNSELVAKDYYEDELQYQKVIDAKNNAAKLTQPPAYTQTANGIKITFSQTEIPDGKKAMFELFRTDDANLDVSKELILNAQNEMFIPAKIIAKGSYTLKINWKKKGTPYQIDYDVLWK